MLALRNVAEARPYRVCTRIVLPLENRGEPYKGPFTTTSTADFLAKVQGTPPRLEALSRDRIVLPHGRLTPTSLLAQTLHTCFNQHVGVSLAPEVLWYTILSQFATDVKQQPELYRDLFTTSAAQEIIKVRHDRLRPGVPDGWDVAIAMFDPALRERIPSAVMDEALPGFTTSTEESNVATLVAFMDAASPFYRYEVHTLCGIPSVRLEGDASDWAQLATSARKLATLASRSPVMQMYFKHLTPVLDTIAESAGGKQNPDFWRSIYKTHSMSGSLNVTGWFTTFFAYINDRKNSAGGVKVKDANAFNWPDLSEEWGGPALGPDAFTSHVSSVPFLWNYLGREIQMRFLSGVLGVDEIDRHLAPRLGWAVAHAS